MIVTAEYAGGHDGWWHELLQEGLHGSTPLRTRTLFVDCPCVDWKWWFGTGQMDAVATSRVGWRVDGNIESGDGCWASGMFTFCLW